MKDTRPGAIVVVGIGNLLWADEGFGVRAVEALHARYAFPDHVQLMDGGTQGIYLLPYVQAAARLLVLDAVDYRRAPGTLVEVRDDDIPAYYGFNKTSLHQANFQELLCLARLSGRSPRQAVLLGVQPLDIQDYGGSLTAPVRARLPEVVEAAARVLARWGAAGTRRSEAPPPLAGEGLALAAYESGRPSAEAAWRLGDARVLNAFAAERP